MLQKEKEKPHQGISKQAVDKRSWLDRQTPLSEGLECEEQGIGQRLESGILETFPSLNECVISDFLQDAMGRQGSGSIFPNVPLGCNPWPAQSGEGTKGLESSCPTEVTEMSPGHLVMSPIKTIHPLISQAATQK